MRRGLLLGGITVGVGRGSMARTDERPGENKNRHMIHVLVAM